MILGRSIGWGRGHAMSLCNLDLTYITKTISCKKLLLGMYIGLRLEVTVDLLFGLYLRNLMILGRGIGWRAVVHCHFVILTGHLTLP